MGIGAFVEDVRLRFWDLVGGGCGHRNSSGCCCEWDGRPRGIAMNGEFCVPSVVHEFDAPESILGVAPPSEDGLSIVGDFAPICLWKKTSQPALQRTVTKRRLLTRPDSRWARRALVGSFVRSRFTACVDIIFAPLGCRTVICTLLFVVLRAGAVGVSSVTEAVVLMNAVDIKLGGLAQPEWFVIEFANIVLVTTSVLLNFAGAPCQVGGVGRPAVGQPVLNVTPPF